MLSGTKSMPAEEVLARVLSENRVRHPAGHELELKASISIENSAALRSLVAARRPQVVVEIGMAYGVSTLAILAALQGNGSGRLISIDPYIGWPTGRLVALHQVALAGGTALHQHLWEPSYTALPRLIAQGVRADLIYIDGNHDYDYVFTDWFLADKLLPSGGLVGFNDAGWSSVHRVIRYVGMQRGYQEQDVGLPRSYRSRNRLFSLLKWLQGRSMNDRWFQKR